MLHPRKWAFPRWGKRQHRPSLSGTKWMVLQGLRGPDIAQDLWTVLNLSDQGRVTLQPILSNTRLKIHTVNVLLNTHTHTKGVSALNYAKLSFI